MSRLEMADSLMRGSGNALGGFNSRVLGDSPDQAYGYPNHPATVGERSSGYWLADGMIKAGKIYYVQHFPHKNCDGHAFTYGGGWVCNKCGQSNIAKSWWKIKVFKDGNAWCCVGEGFEDLQESDNFAFGDTREEAIKNYGELMEAKP